MKILRRYILREHIGPFIAALGVLTGLMLLNQLAKRFSDLVGKGLPWYVIGEVFALSVPFIVAMSMPMAVLVAVLYSFGRLASDNEISAIKAGGVSLLRLMLPVIAAASLIAGSMIWFNDKILPESNHALRQLLFDINRKQPTFELRERVVNEVVPGELFLQAARIDRVRSVLWDMVIFDLGRSETERTIYADSGHMAFNEAQTDLYLTLYDGSMHELDVNVPDTDQRTYYGKQVLRVSGVTNELQRGGGVEWRGDREMSIGMMREEVRKRSERLFELQDSLNRIILLTSPTREALRAERPDTSKARLEEDEGASAPAHTAGPSQELPPDAAPLRGPTRPRPTAKRGALEAQTAVTPIRRNVWPPEGDPDAFAGQLRSELRRLGSRIELQRRELNRYSVEIHKKFAIPIAAIVFVLIGAPVAVRFPRGGIGMVIGVSLSVFCVYYIFLIGGEDFADRGYMSPFWSMWAPNALFGVAGCVILYWVGRAGTRRLNSPFYRLRRRGRTPSSRPIRVAK